MRFGDDDFRSELKLKLEINRRIVEKVSDYGMQEHQDAEEV